MRSLEHHIVLYIDVANKVGLVNDELENYLRQIFVSLACLVGHRQKKSRLVDPKNFPTCKIARCEDGRTGELWTFVSGAYFP
jgi:hypothetical protein